MAHQIAELLGDAVERNKAKACIFIGLVEFMTEGRDCAHELLIIRRKHLIVCTCYPRSNLISAATQSMVVHYSPIIVLLASTTDGTGRASD